MAPRCTGYIEGVADFRLRKWDHLNHYATSLPQADEALAIGEHEFLVEYEASSLSNIMPTPAEVLNGMIFKSGFLDDCVLSEEDEVICDFLEAEEPEDDREAEAFTQYGLAIGHGGPRY